jgi:hypothetical protein
MPPCDLFIFVHLPVDKSPLFDRLPVRYMLKFSSFFALPSSLRGRDRCAYVFVMDLSVEGDLSLARIDSSAGSISVAPVGRIRFDTPGFVQSAEEGVYDSKGFYSLVHKQMSANDRIKSSVAS